MSARMRGLMRLNAGLAILALVLVVVGLVVAVYGDLQGDRPLRLVGFAAVVIAVVSSMSAPSLWR